MLCNPSQIVFCKIITLTILLLYCNFLSYLQAIYLFKQFHGCWLPCWQLLVGSAWIVYRVLIVGQLTHSTHL